ncbi:hypothetical protein [Brazilian marseillevirus]|uniref:hypothetical protein n=1 Tax=Brazilian marseillevirus TaxID=1813599 RepID=UPI000786664F|nr:hypothetical protein A3303_gp405 [Brazilian marseillevirus]AMQ10913.1 hypothetical protein [Brazilian marseillevirus]
MSLKNNTSLLKQTSFVFVVFGRMSKKFLSSYLLWLDGFSYPEEKFASEYLHGDREEVIKYISILNPNYDGGYLLIVVVREGDIKFLELLLEKKPKRKCLDSALCTAALYNGRECAKLLIRHGADPNKFRGTTSWEFVESVVEEMKQE